MDDYEYEDYDDDKDENFETCSFCGFILIRRKDNGECVTCWKIWETETED